MKILKKVLKIAFYVICALITCCFVVYLLMFLGFIASRSDVPDDEKTVNFSDGTVLERTGGPTYTHTLPDGFVFDKNDTRFEGKIRHDENGYAASGYIMRYAYDGKGNIAFRRLEHGSEQEPLYEWQNYTIVFDRTVLYNSYTNTETVFESMNELYDYCEVQNIELGAWRYPVGYTPVEENIVLESGKWTIASNTLDYCVIDNGSQELFSGYVDKYFEDDNYFGFHFQHMENGDYSIAENPVIAYSTEEVVGKKYAGLIFFYNDVYADKYVLVNSKTDEYTVFESKKELKQFAKANDIDISWDKIEY